jgi:serine/threonine protein kinase
VDSTTPKKPRPMPPLGEHDDTSVTYAIAPWDSAGESSVDTAPGSDDHRTTQQTSAITLREYELAPGMKLGEYQLEQKLGQGGMGVVYAAVHPLIGKRAAIKILKKELCADPGQLERFVDEARVVNQIGHPNIVDVFAFGEMPDGRRYFVMELLEGETLRARLAKKRLSLDEVRSIIKPLARALQAAHDKGVIHRDLKPDNVFLVDVRDGEPTAKLLDFGIAKLAKNDHRVEKTATGAIVGTPQYIAPEQAKGYPIDSRADIYALGAILFELLTGRPPFIADNAMEMVAKHLMEAPVRPSTIQRGIISELDDLVFRMLAKTPDGRPSLGELIAVIERSRTSAATLPFDRPTPPPPKSDPITAASPPISDTLEAENKPIDRSSRPLPGVPSSTTAVPARPAWVVPAIFAVPIVAVLAFVIVSKLGAPESKRTPDPTPVSEPTTEPTTEPKVPPTVEPLKIESAAPNAPETTTQPIEPPPIDKTVERPIKKPPPKIAPKKDPPRKDPAKRDPAKKDPTTKGDPPKGEFTIPDGDGLATPKK